MSKLDATVESAWIERLRPEFARFGATPPTHLTEIYRSFVEDDDMLATLLQERPKVVQFGRCSDPDGKQRQNCQALGCGLG